jgi:hypothetical protein
MANHIMVRLFNMFSVLRFFILAMLLAANVVAEDLECETPSSVCSALEKYTEAIEALSDDEWRLSDTLANEALQYHAYDDDSLIYQTTCLISEGSGFVKQVNWVACDQTYSYKPNELISDIRDSHPPSPVYQVKLVTSPGKGWMIGAKPLKAIVQVNNFGGSSMENVEVAVSSLNAKKNISKSLGTIAPEQSQRFSFPLVDKGITFSVTEQYGFNHPPTDVVFESELSL